MATNLSRYNQSLTRAIDATKRPIDFEAVPSFSDFTVSTCGHCDGSHAFISHHERNDALASNGAVELDHAWLSSSSAILLWWSLPAIGCKELVLKFAST